MESATTSAPESVAERLAARITSVRAELLPTIVREQVDRLLLDVAGLCIAARHTDYVAAVKRAVDADGPCTAIGHRERFRAEDAALLNGTAAHGEDFDDTFEGGPVHSGAVVVPAVLAACERFGRDGAAAQVGIALGVETMCRLALVRPKAIHDAGFHPTAILGTFAAAAGVGAALRCPPSRLVDAFGIAGSLTGGIIEYLAEGASTKRLHAGAAARAGLQAARLGAEGFSGPRTVFEGVHGMLSAFARSSEGDFEALTDAFGEHWHMTELTFKPYATGTMNQPYIDCARRLAAQGVRAEEVVDVVCETAQGYVPRLWEPLHSKQRPANAYAAKFSTPFNIAVAFVHGDVGLGAFTDATVNDARVLALAAKVRYVVDPNNPYPRRYTGHVRMTLRDGRVLEERQHHIRGGKHEPLSRRDLELKFLGNAQFGGLDDACAHGLLHRLSRMLTGQLDLAPLRV